MSNQLGEKAMACLRLASLDKISSDWQLGYDAACASWSEKAVITAFESLVRRGYIECGVSARTGWLTEKGREALERGLS